MSIKIESNKTYRPYDSIGGAIKHYRKKAGLTQEQLAKATGISRSTIGKLEIGMHTPTQETLDKLAVVLGEQVYRGKFGWRKVLKKRGRPRREVTT